MPAPVQGSEGGRHGAARALRAQLEEASTAVREIANHLQSSYPAEGLSQLSQRFESISKQFTNFALIKSHIFYALIHRSEARLAAVNRIAKEARDVAILFEQCARNPNSYSVSMSRGQIHDLEMALENLKMFLPPVKGAA